MSRRRSFMGSRNFWIALIAINAFSLTINSINIMRKRNKEKAEADKAKQEVVQVQEVKVPQSLNNYMPLSVRELSSGYHNEPVKVTAEPVFIVNEKVRHPHAEGIGWYSITATQDGNDMHAVLNNNTCYFETDDVKALDEKVSTIIGDNKNLSPSSRVEIVFYGQNRSEQGRAKEILLHKVQIGPTVFDIMRCQQ